MGQENEEAAELIATIKCDHVAMKSWYNDPKHRESSISGAKLNEMHSKYGKYPDFWKDVVSWSGWKEARKSYLHFLAGSESTTDLKSDTKSKLNSNENGNNKKDVANQIPKKRRSRWASQTQTSNTVQDGGTATNPPPTKRKSRWARCIDNNHIQNNPPSSTTNNVTTHTATGSNNNINAAAKPTAATGILGLLPGMPAGMTQEQLSQLSTLQNRLRTVNEKLATLDIEAIRVDALPREHPDRSPSPPPVYGADGVRKNTRAIRWRERYTNERQDCLEKIMDLNPALRPPGFVKRKRHKKVYVPVHEHPTYNFIGLIIGPRGKTQKEMENKTGCKIAIRGKGSVKEGARGRRDGKPMEGDDEPLHVVITGEDQASVDTAAEMIQKMLVVIDDEKNVHKQQQLRELALLNGTLKDEEFCHICAEKGHRTFECPKRFNLNKPINTIKCAICGDTSHPTRDCTMKKNNSQQDEQQLDSDYQNFMNELDGKLVSPDQSTAKNTSGDNKQDSLGQSNIVSISSSANATGTFNPVTGTIQLQSTPNISSDVSTNVLPPVVLSALPPPPINTIPPPPSLQSNVTFSHPPPPFTTNPQTSNLMHQNNPKLPTADGTIPQPSSQQLQHPALIQTIPPPPPPQLGIAQPLSQVQYNPQTAYYGGVPNHGYGNPAISMNTVYNHNHGITASQQIPTAPTSNNTNHGGAYEEETSGWDYRSFYGTDHTSGDSGGAGGFNWWESSN